MQSDPTYSSEVSCGLKVRSWPVCVHTTHQSSCSAFIAIESGLLPSRVMWPRGVSLNWDRRSEEITIRSLHVTVAANSHLEGRRVGEMASNPNLRSLQGAAASVASPHFAGDSRKRDATSFFSRRSNLWHAAIATGLLTRGPNTTCHAQVGVVVVVVAGVAAAAAAAVVVAAAALVAAAAAAASVAAAAALAKGEEEGVVMVVVAVVVVV